MHNLVHVLIKKITIQTNFLTAYSFALAELLLPAGRRYTFMYPLDLGNQAWDCQKFLDLVSLDPRHNFHRFAANSDKIYFFVTKGLIPPWYTVDRYILFTVLAYSALSTSTYISNYC